MKRILVTGGAGFLGSHLCEKLVNDGHHVICLDNLDTGSLENICQLLYKSNFEFIEHSVIEPFDIEVDEIYNLACPASPISYQKNPIQTIKTSVLGAINTLNLALRYGAKVLQASTSEVYGDPEEHPQSESYWGNVNPIGPRACYDEGKRIAETLFMEYYNAYLTEIRLVRIFNTYGPRMDPHDGRVVSNFIRQALNNEDITIYGDGSQTRSFCYVSDLIRGLIKMMEAPDNCIGPINLGNPNEFSILELALRVIKLTKSNSRLIYTGLPIDDPKRRKPNISLATKNLDWEPMVALQDGLTKTIGWFRR